METSENRFAKNSNSSSPFDDTEDDRGKPEADVTSQPVMTAVFEDFEGRSSMELAYGQLVVILSGLYGIFLVVLGLVLPITEVMCTARFVRAKNFEVFYIYLYLVSMLFLAYVYSYLLRRDGTLSLAWVSDKFSRKVPQNAETQDTSSTHPSVFSMGRSRNAKVVFMSTATSHTGSFYLRVGAVGFGLGAMIHSAIMFGHSVEMSQSDHPCSDLVQVLKPFTHMCFSFSQMYFVFMNSKMSIHKYQSLARFGLMHMCGTNVCVWLRAVLVETVRVMEINEWRQLHRVGDLPADGGGGNGTKTRDPHLELKGTGHLPELKCHSDAVMGKLQASSSVYLFPCTIEYSLICAGVLCVMWYNVGQGTRLPKTTSLFDTSSPTHDTSLPAHDTSCFDWDEDQETRRKTQRISVDCDGSSQGLFLGVAVLVGALCCLIWFYVLIGQTDKHLMARSLLGHLSADFIYLLTLTATVIAAFQMKDMHFALGLHAGIDEILTLVSLAGLGLFGVFSILASMFYLETLDGQLTVMTNVVMLVQAGSQATFMLTCLTVSAINKSQARQKPGRNCVTFLLVSNFTLWVLNTFEIQRLEHNVVQVDFYGSNAWSIFSHISVPLGIYYRFHSTVCLSNIWKYAWRTSKGDD